MLKELGLRSGHCPFMSCRAWELVHGHLAETFKELREMCLMELMEDLNSKDFPEEVIARVLPEFRRLLNHLELNIAVKFAWLKELPWSLLGLCHPILRKARAWARTLVDRWLRLTPSQQQTSHRLTRKFLAPGLFTI